MTRDDIIKLAREAGLTERNRHSEIVVRHSNGSWVDVEQVLTRFARLVSAAEREACAALCDDIAQEEQGKFDRDYSREDTAEELAVLIRARGQQ